MGRNVFAAQRVHQHATQLLERNRLNFPPPWYNSIGSTPPSTRLTRPPLQRSRGKGKKSSRMFQPAHIKYEEDRLRWEYFNDHPWELARPRVILEDDGQDGEKYDWGVELDVSFRRPMQGEQDSNGRTVEDWENIWAKHCARPINGESVVQRQLWLMHNNSMSEHAAYDKARKEFYRVRHAREIERRVAREEAISTGAYFGLSQGEIGMKLEDEQYEDWRAWAEKETAALKQQQGALYTSTDNEDSVISIEESDQVELQEVSSAIPASSRGQGSLGGAAIHP